MTSPTTTRRRWADYDDILTAAETADILKVSVSTLVNWRKRPNPPLVPVIAEGQVVRYALSDVRKLCKGGRSR